jgi:hypothetical protein
MGPRRGSSKPDICPLHPEFWMKSKFKRKRNIPNIIKITSSLLNMFLS